MEGGWLDPSVGKCVMEQREIFSRSYGEKLSTFEAGLSWLSRDGISTSSDQVGDDGGLGYSFVVSRDGFPFVDLDGGVCSERLCDICYGTTFSVPQSFTSVSDACLEKYYYSFNLYVKSSGS